LAAAILASSRLHALGGLAVFHWGEQIMSSEDH
jgi:hypothetical protein